MKLPVEDEFHSHQNIEPLDESELIENVKNMKGYASKPCMDLIRSCFNEDFSMKMNSYDVDGIPKRFLKKCRNCGFKKRSCVRTKMSCKALQLTCYTCKKLGHFPKSLQCKRRKHGTCIKNIQDDESSTSSSDESMILQFDGGDDTNKSFTKKIYAVNCEIDEICIVSNFFRSCDFLWILGAGHEKCEYNSKHKEWNCFFCNVRSSFLRLSAERKKGPKSLKLYEFVFQMFRYEKLAWNWQLQKQDVAVFIANTMKLLRREENSISQAFNPLSGICQKCNEEVSLK